MKYNTGILERPSYQIEVLNPKAMGTSLHHSKDSLQKKHHVAKTDFDKLSIQITE